ncbi:threonine--tRNA ligase [Candidatus Woesearchaeota archaeon]|nr:threonine--tRNA ligase [Candidatus Woesearchaeota archaeon]RLE42886.1 MAG: threonine--tRNA ligase [Candidatus Woesearchaeota archaeon]
MAQSKFVSLEIKGKKHRFKAGITAEEVAQKLGLSLDGVIAARVGDTAIDLNRPITHSGVFKLLSFKDTLGKEIFWHSSAHLLAAAILKLYPKAKPAIGPPIEEGFYYDFYNLHISQEDFPKIEAEMKKLVHENHPFLREEISNAKAKQLFKGNKFKLEILKELEKPSIYHTGNFVDLCRGPHVPSTKYLHAIKLTKLSGAYWRGDAKREQLTRVYGISFPTKEELKAYITRLEEAEKRDHRKIGARLELFSFHEEGPGFMFWHNNGMIIFNELLDYWKEEHRKAGYQLVMTPIILRKTLWLQSGHWEHYKEHMYFTEIDGEEYAVKPMNCPGGILIYKSRKHSYREFPIRMAEVGLVHRHELSGVLHGLMRVRAFWQDDAHIYCLPEQMEDEIIGVVKLVDKFYKVFGFEYSVELSTRPEKFMGKREHWDKAEDTLKSAMKKIGKPFTINEGEGAFYGPKLDFHIRDALGRSWQCATIQLDFQMPEKFDLRYMGPDGTENHRPVMIHRVVYGSFDRFIGILLEHFAGKLPLWLSPYQVRILTIGERFNDYAYKINKMLFEAGIRTQVDDSDNTISKKVREAQLDKVNYMVIVGEKEATSNTLAVRTRAGKTTYGVKLRDFLKQLKDEIAKKKIV